MKQDDDQANDTPKDKKLSKSVSEEPPPAVDFAAQSARPSGSERFKDDYLESSAIKAARDLIDSPAYKLARDFANSPSQQFATQVARGLGPDFAIRAIANAKAVTISDALKPRLGITDTLASLKPMTIDRSMLDAMGAIRPTAIDPALLAAFQGIQPIKIDPGLALAVQNAQKALEEAMRPIGGVAKAVQAFEEQHRAVQKSLLASLAGPIGDIARTGQWTSMIGKFAAPEFALFLDGNLGAAVDNMRTAIARNFSDTVALDQAKTSEMLGLSARFESDFASTQLKMSVLAGISETFSPLSHMRIDAYSSLFGEWRTHVDLPDQFWRDGRVRKRMYRDAEVDDGLIVAPPGVALEVMIESGLTTGFRSETNAVAVVTLGEVSMTVRSRGTRKDAYAILDRFEVEMRRYVSRKLEEGFGPDWFKVRASNLIGKAKGIRKAAMERGEAFAPLINFIELGELSGIILNARNWDDVFGDVFINRAEFDHDMQKLIATRRPTMHIRSIDSVRLVELICVVQRLSDQMADDGAWKIAAEFDH